MEMSIVRQLMLTQKDRQANLPYVVLPILQYRIPKFSAFAHIEM